MQRGGYNIVKDRFVKRHLWQMVLCILAAAGLGVLPVVTVKLTQIIVDEAAVASGLPAALGAAVLWMLLAKLLSDLLTWLNKMCGLSISSATEIETGEELLGLCRELDLAFFEQADTYDRISRLRNNGRYLYFWGMNGLVVLCTGVISMAGIFIILASAGWKVLLVSLAAILPIWAVNIRLTFLENQGWTDNYNRVRRQQYFSDVICTREHLKETRTFNSFGFFEKKWEKAYDEYNRALIRLTVSTRGAGAAVAFLTAVGVGAVIWILLPAVGQGAATLGLLVAVVEGLQQLGGDFKWTINGAVWNLLRARTMARDLEILREHARRGETMDADTVKHERPEAVGAGMKEILAKAENTGTDTENTEKPVITEAQPMEVEDVWFRYPGSDRYILRGITFRIEPGEQVALVGENGSGKSTLAKLVLGLYRPERGSIRYGGVDVNLLTPGQRKEIFGVVFQDYAKYEISLRENLAFADLDDQTHDEEYIAALEKVGGGKILSDCGSLDAVIGRRIDGGTDLSNGQWQKLAIARAISGQVRFTVLDEPSSAADPLAEAEIYRQYAELARHAGGLLITHRLACIQFCSHILVLDGGTVAEQGTHEELTARDGIYAQMYQMQKGWYL